MKRELVNITTTNSHLVGEPIIMGEKLYNEWKKWEADGFKDDPSTRIVGWHHDIPVYVEP